MRARIFVALFLLFAAPLLAAQDRLEQVVALFRHGIRAPLHDLNDPKYYKTYAGKAWPAPESAWGAKDWGGLTRHGADVAQALGKDYADHYKRQFPAGFKAFFYADIDERTKDTARALVRGFRSANVPVDFDWRAVREGEKDPLFHAFKGYCGKPSVEALRRIASDISRDAPDLIKGKYGPTFQLLYGALNCTDTTKCKKLESVDDNSATYCIDADHCDSSPIRWAGQFPYANTATEVFLLEYANNMDYAWSRVSEADMRKMVHLHDVYFERTQRDSYLAQIDASNLVREINDTLRDENKECRRISNAYQFAGLVGHDTNIASLGSLLGLTWQFDTAPEGTAGLPKNDPLPAGALVFERWKRSEGTFINISYVAQGLKEMRACKPDAKCPSFRVPVLCAGSVKKDACELSLDAFNSLANKVANTDFQSSCRTCPKVGH